MSNRTDLAVEIYEEKEKTLLQGVKITEKDNITVVDVLDEQGAREIGKPVGRYVTLQVDDFINDTDILDGRLTQFSTVLKSLMPNACKSILVAGLGNKNITADSLGPDTISFILATRHIINDAEKDIGINDLFPVSCVATGVLGETGIETLEIVKGITNQTKPSCVIIVDALAASSAERLGTTIQFSNAGISPGSGVGNHRHEISRGTLGVPVISIGIPTVVSTSILSGNENDSLFVTPREIDRISQQGAKLIGMGINVCLQKSLSPEELLALVG